MIEINLLPQSMRKAESTPLPRFIVMCLGIAVICGFLMFLLRNHLFWIPKKERVVSALKAEVEKKEVEAAKLEELDAKIEKISIHVNTVKNLFRTRLIYAKLLWDIKQILNQDEMVNKANPDRQYIWLTNLMMTDQSIKTSGFCSATSEVVALRMVRELYTRFLSYRAVRPPEEEERKKLTELISMLKVEWAKRRSQNDQLPPKSPEQEEAEAKLEALSKAKRSGRIAVKPFSEFFESGSIMLESTQWSAGGKAGRGLANPTLLPVGSQNFRLNMKIKPPKSDDEEEEY